MNRFLIVPLCLGMAWHELSSQEVRCSASVESAVVESGTAFTLTVEIMGEQVSEIEQPVLPAMRGIEVLYNNAGVSTSIQIINGRRSETKTFQYLLRAKEAGRWTVPSLAASFRGRKYLTQPLTIEVVPVGKISGGAVPDEASGDVFVALIPSKKEAFVGEQILIQLKIFSRLTVSQYEPHKMPNFVGFWVEDFPLKQPLETEREQIGGVLYTTYVIRRSAIFPTRSGTLTIDEAEIECELRMPRKGRGGRSEDFFSPFADPLGQTVVKTFRSTPVEITVKDLPVTGRPPGFSGLVGNFEMKTSVDRVRLKTGEALIFTVETSGIGNVNSADIPGNPFPDDFEKYEPKVSTEIGKTGNVISGRKMVEFIVVPRSAGVYEIPPPAFSFFDPTHKKYVSKPLTSHTITVEQGAVVAEGDRRSRREIEMMTQDIRFIKTSFETWNAGSLLSWWMVGIWTIPALVWGAVYAYARRREFNMQNQTQWHYRKASPTALRRLKTAERLASSGRQQQFYSEIAKTLVGFVADKLRLKGTVSREDVVHRLKVRRIPDDLIKQFLYCLESCDAARYSPDRESPLLIDETLQLVKNTLLSMDRHL